MHERCNPENIEERKFSRKELPIKECRECLFNAICLDYSIYEESNAEKENADSKKDCAL